MPMLSKLRKHFSVPSVSACLLVLVLVIWGSASEAVFAAAGGNKKAITVNNTESDYKVIYNGKEISLGQKAIISENVMMLPLKELFTVLDAQIFCNDEDGIWNVSSDGKSLSLSADSSSAALAGR